VASGAASRAHQRRVVSIRRRVVRADFPQTDPAGSRRAPPRPTTRAWADVIEGVLTPRRSGVERTPGRG
jgi:hypothetical protein